MEVFCQFAQRYEALRRAHLKEGWSGRGQALLMRHGMVSWMQATATDVATDGRPIRLSPPDSEGHSKQSSFAKLDIEPFQAETICVLTSMAVGALQEVLT